MAGYTGAKMKTKYVKIERDKLHKFVEEQVKIGNEFSRILDRSKNRAERMRYTVDRWNAFLNTPGASLDEVLKKVTSLSSDERIYQLEMSEDEMAFAKNSVRMIELVQGFLPD